MESGVEKMLLNPLALLDLVSQCLVLYLRDADARAELRGVLSLGDVALD